MTVYNQDGYTVRLEWGSDGARRLAPHCAVLVIVDILVFSTSVTVAIGRGGRVLPLPWRDERAAEAARQAGALLAPSGLIRTADGITGDPNVDIWTLRPSSLVGLPAGTFLAIASANGGTLCAAAASSGTTVLAGSLRNAAAVGAAARGLAGGRPVGVVPAGERWHEPDALRPALEDLLGAGALVGALHLPGRSPEAEVAALAYAAAGDRIGELLAGSASGRELIHAGLPGDVELAAGVDRDDVVPILVDGVFERWAG